MTRVLYNATAARVGGGLIYAINQVATLAEQTDLEATVLVAPWNRGLFAELLTGAPRATVREVKLANASHRFAWEQIGLPVLARRFDVVVSPANFGPLLRSTPGILIQQNANYVGQGPQLPQNAAVGRRVKIRLSHWSMRRATAVVAISDALADEIRSEPKLRDIALTVIRSGAASPRSDATDPTPHGAEVISGLVGDDPYVLVVASDYPHKRLDDAASAVPLLDAQSPAVPRHVVFVGDVTSERREVLRRMAHPFGDRLHFVGVVADRDLLDDFSRGAAVSIAPTELESWDLVLHEAAAVGCPLVVSDIPVHREIAGPDVVFFPVGDVDRLVGAIVEVTSHPRPRPWSFDRSWSEHGRELADLMQRTSR